MTDIFISYARSTATQAQQVAEALKAMGYAVWRDDELPAHRAYADVIEERLRAAKAVVVIWSADAVKSEWVRSEADRARTDHKLVQLAVDTCQLPMPFDQIECADISGWSGQPEAPGWRKVVASVTSLVGGTTAAPATAGPAVAYVAPLPLPTKPSIALMPFANLSGDPDQEYFADGMVVEIAQALSRFRSIFVIAGGSTLSFKGQAVSPHEVGRKLGVRYVLEGNVRKAGARVRIGVQLIGAVDGLPVWTDRFEDTLDDIFALQDKVALAVAGKIEPTVQTAEIRRAAARRTGDMGSYDLYLRAMQLHLPLAREGTLEALVVLERAIAVDPGNGPALALAAICHWLVILNQWSDDFTSHRRQALNLADRAVRAAGDDAEVLARAGPVLQLLGDNSSAAALLERAMGLNPGSSVVWAFNGMVNMRRGRLDLAVSQMETALRMDPVSPWRAARLLTLGLSLLMLSRFTDALPVLREAQPGPSREVALAVGLARLGEIDEAREALGRYETLTSAPIGLAVAALVSDPALRSRLLEGIALAEGRA